MDRSQIEFERPRYDNKVTFTFSEQGLLIELEEEQAVGSYNDNITTSFTLTKDEIAQLREFLSKLPL